MDWKLRKLTCGHFALKLGHGATSPAAPHCSSAAACIADACRASASPSERFGPASDSKAKTKKRPATAQKKGILPTKGNHFSLASRFLIAPERKRKRPRTGLPGVSMTL